MHRAIKYLVGLLILVCTGILFAVAPDYVSIGNPIRESLQNKKDIHSASAKTASSELLFEERVEHSQREEIYTYAFTGSADESVVFYWENLAEEIRYGVNIELTGPTGEVVPSARYPVLAVDEIYPEESEGMAFAFALPTTGEYRLNFRISRSRRQPEIDLPEVAEHLLRLRRASGYEHFMIVANTLFESEAFEQAVSAYELAIQANPNGYEAYFWQTYAYGQASLVSLDHAEEIAEIQQTIGQQIDAAPSSQTGALTLEAVYLSFQLLDAEEQEAVIRNLEELSRLAATLPDSEELSADPSDLMFYTDAIALLQTGVASEYLAENYDFLYYFFLSRRYG